MAEGLPAAGAEQGGGFFLFARQILQHRLHRAHHEGQADEGERHPHTQRRVADLEGQQAADPAIRSVQRGQRDAGHGGGQGEGQVDHGIQQATAGKFIAHQHPGHQQAGDCIGQRGQEGGTERQLVRGDYLGVGGDVPERFPAQLCAAEKHRSQRDQHDQAQVQHGDAERQVEAGQHAVALEQRVAPGARSPLSGEGRGGHGRRGKREAGSHGRRGEAVCFKGEGVCRWRTMCWQPSASRPAARAAPLAPLTCDAAPLPCHRCRHR